MAQHEPFLSAHSEATSLLARHSHGDADGAGALLGTAGPKSLFYCLVLDNPFDEECPETRCVDQSLFQGEREGGENPPTGLSDDELLQAPPSAESFVSRMKRGEEHVPAVPNKFQKVIEILLRMQTRGVDYLPPGMLRAAQDTSPTNPNHFCGYELVKEKLLSSPDGDEMYIKIHCKREVLLSFAEAQSVVLNTHPLSFTGGAPVPYNKELEKKLSASVSLFCEAYPYELDADDAPAESPVNGAGRAVKKPKREGFRLDVPDKMRILTRLMREAWKYGGCGIQIAEMKKKGVLVRHFFPIHNPAYQEAYQLTKWASFRQMFTSDPLYQIDDHVMKYFGEEVALYFVWIRHYTRFLRYIAFFGLVAAAFGYAAQYDTDAHQYFPISLVNGIFSALCCIWGMTWNFYWRRHETLFSVQYGQEAQMRQELVRDEFECDRELQISVPDIYKSRFDLPLTLRNSPDGSMIDLHYSPWKRSLVRYLVSYPVILILSGGMATALIYSTKWRFTYPDDQLVSYGSSVLTVVIGFVFGAMFEVMVPTLNSWENNRTDSEETAQSIGKSFLFYFLSYYFALFTIVLWPSDASGETDNYRLDQLASQMLVITLVKPMIQNAQELLVPVLNAEFRRRRDVYKSSVKAFCSLLCCRRLPDDSHDLTPLQREGQKLWIEAQMEPYESTSGDYLEITLQFGYMTMFASTFPLATVAALLYNILEIRVDARKLLFECQRPQATPATTIGAWNGIFLFISVLSVVTNSYLTMIVSPFPKQIRFGLDQATRYKLFAASQYIMVSGFFLMYLWQGGQSVEADKLKAKHNILANKATRLKFERIMADEMQKTDDKSV